MERLSHVNIKKTARMFFRTRQTLINKFSVKIYLSRTTQYRKSWGTKVHSLLAETFKVTVDTNWEQSPFTEPRTSFQLQWMENLSRIQGMDSTLNYVLFHRQDKKCPSKWVTSCLMEATMWKADPMCKMICAIFPSHAYLSKSNINYKSTGSQWGFCLIPRSMVSFGKINSPKMFPPK